MRECSGPILLADMVDLLWNVVGGDDNATNASNVNADTIQYNIRLLHRSQTATTSNMKQMNTKYNYLIVET